MVRSGQLFRITRDTVRFLLPWIARGGMWIFEMTLRAYIAIWVGFTTMAPRMAELFQTRGLNLGIPGIYDLTLYRIGLVLAWLNLVTAWIVQSFITVWLVRLVLRMVLGLIWS